MTQKEQLWENYEDAVFAILMDAVAEQEGEKGLQLMEELEHDPSAQVPEEVQKRAEKTIRKAFAAQSRRSARHVGFRMFQRIAVAVMIVILTAVCAFAAFPEMRANVLNMIEQTFSDHTDFNVTSGDSDEYSSATFTIKPAWLPENFSLTDEGENNASVFSMYENGTGGVLFISESEATDTSMAVDTEDAEVEAIQVQGYDGKLIQKENMTCILFLISEKNMLVYIDSEGIPSEQTLKVAENLSIN